MRRMLLACFVLAVLGTTPAEAREGALTQLAGQSGCVSDSGTGGMCGDAVEMRSPSETALSPDGRFLYVAGSSSDSIAVFDRDPVTGTIAQKFGDIGCVSVTGSTGQCKVARGIDGVDGLVVSPDGLTLYAAGFDSDAIAILDIDQSTGTLSQDAGPAGCVSETGAGGCTDGKALDGAVGIALSASSTSLYVASYESDAVAVFDRDPVGNLTQKAGSAGCISEDGSGGACQDGRGLNGPYPGLAVTTDGKSVYVPALLGDAIAVLGRASDGSLTQDAGTAGCVQDAGLDGCADGRALGRPSFVLASPDGKRVYSSNSTTNSVAVFERSADGTIAQKTGFAGCVSDDGSGGDCVDGKALQDPVGLGMSRDGATLYVGTIASDGIAIFDISAATGALTQLPGTQGCVAATTLSGACTLALGTRATRGRISVSPDGAFLYGAGSEDDTVTVFARSPNLRPTCTPLSASTPFGQPLALTLACTDADDDPFKIRIAEGPRGGSTPDLNNFTSTVTYVPAPGFSGPDIFTYSAEDAGGMGAPAAVTLTVGPGSLAGPGTGTTTTPKKKTAAPKTVGITRLATVPSNKKCLSRRSFKIKLRNVKAGKIVSAQVKLRGKIVRTLKGKTLSVSVNLKGLPKGTFTLEIVTTDSSGSRLSGKRRYKTCAVKKKAKAKTKKQTAK